MGHAITAELGQLLWMSLDALGRHAYVLTLPEPVCFRCKRRPAEIGEYVGAAALEQMTPDDYVRLEEGTYNSENGHFACTNCYYEIGAPSTPMGWKAP